MGYDTAEFLNSTSINKVLLDHGRVFHVNLLHPNASPLLEGNSGASTVHIRKTQTSHTGCDELPVFDLMKLYTELEDQGNPSLGCLDFAENGTFLSAEHPNAKVSPPDIKRTTVPSSSSHLFWITKSTIRHFTKFLLRSNALLKDYLMSSQYFF